MIEAFHLILKIIAGLMVGAFALGLVAAVILPLFQHRDKGIGGPHQ